MKPHWQFSFLLLLSWTLPAEELTNNRPSLLQSFSYSTPALVSRPLQFAGVPLTSPHLTNGWPTRYGISNSAPPFALPAKITAPPLTLNAGRLQSTFETSNNNLFLLDENYDRLNARYRYFNGHDILTQSIPVPPSRLDRIFSMEVIKVGHVHLSGSLVTATKRKNPLYLLSPIIFVASW